MVLTTDVAAEAPLVHRSYKAKHSALLELGLIWQSVLACSQLVAAAVGGEVVVGGIKVWRVLVDLVHWSYKAKHSALLELGLIWQSVLACSQLVAAAVGGDVVVGGIKVLRVLVDLVQASYSEAQNACSSHESAWF